MKNNSSQKENILRYKDFVELLVNNEVIEISLNEGHKSYISIIGNRNICLSKFEPLNEVLLEEIIVNLIENFKNEIQNETESSVTIDTINGRILILHKNDYCCGYSITYRKDLS